MRIEIYGRLNCPDTVRALSWFLEEEVVLLDGIEVHFLDFRVDARYEYQLTNRRTDGKSNIPGFCVDGEFVGCEADGLQAVQNAVAEFLGEKVSPGPRSGFYEVFPR
jgi:hypothetical protein